MKKYVENMKEYICLLYIDSGTWKNLELSPRLWQLDKFRSIQALGLGKILSFPLGSGTEKILGSPAPSNAGRGWGVDTKHDLYFWLGQ